MNGHGKVVGEVYSEELNWQPTTAVWHRDEKTRYFYQGPAHSPKVINDSSTIVGEHGLIRFPHDLNPPSSEMYIWNEETGYGYFSSAHLHEEGALPRVVPKGLSNTGFAVGTSTTLYVDDLYIPVIKGWIWSSSEGLVQIPSLDTSLGYEITSPSAVNDEGVVVGHYGYGFFEGGGHAMGGFVYNSVDGIVPLKDVDDQFFGTFAVQPTSINNRKQIVGMISYDFAFVYDLEGRSGTSFSGFDAGVPRVASAQANSINNLGIVVGVAEDWERASTDEGREVPFIWSSEHGKTRLTDYTTIPLQSFLPEGQDIERVSYEVHAINDDLQILLAMYYYEQPNVREGIPLTLHPVLSYPFQFKGRVAGPDKDLLVFAHSAKSDEGTLSPERIGMTIIHEFSVDGKYWQQLEHGSGGVEIVTTDDELQIRLPEQPSVFIRSFLAVNADGAE